MTAARALRTLNWFLLLLATAALAQGPTTYYVATNGNNTWSGTLEAPAGNDGPFRTLARARDVIRARIAAGMTSDITVLVRGGEHFQEFQVNFAPADSGRDGFKVIYKNYPGEQPIFNRGRRLTGWQLDSGNVYRVPVDWTFHTLYENGVRAVKARHPNITATDPYVYSRVTTMIAGAEKKRFGFRAGDIPVVQNPTELEVMIWPGGPRGERNWVSNILTVSAVDYAGRIVTLGSNLTLVNTTEARYELGVGSRYFVQGVRELLDAPGEFWIGGGFLYYWPRQTPIENQVIIAPGPGNSGLIFFLGRSPTETVHDIVLEGLAFGFTDRFRDAISLSHAERLTIQGNRIFNTGGYGIVVVRSSRNNVIEGNLIHDAGHDGIIVIGSSLTDAGENPAFNRVVNNYVFRTGQVIAHGAGIQLNRTSNSLVSHNLVHDTPRFSIQQSGEIDLLIATNNTIEFNDVSRANLDSQDAGPLYTGSAGPGTIIHNNRVHDSDMPFSFGTGIYLDGDSKQATVIKNVVHDLQQRVSDAVTLSGVVVKGPEFRILNNIWAHNRFAAGDLRLQHSDGDIATREGEILRNILYRNGTAHMYHLADWEESQLRVTDYNLFFHDGAAYDVGFRFGRGFSPGTFETLAQWRSGHGRRHDQNSIFADPRFVDPDNRDYRLRPDSPAYALGFEDIDFANIGLRADFPFANPEEELARIFVTSNVSGPAAGVRLRPGGTAQLTVIGRTRTGYIANLANAAISFASDNPNIATVDSQGVITARSFGVATITITVIKDAVRKSTVAYAVVGALPPRSRQIVVQ